MALLRAGPRDKSGQAPPRGDTLTDELLSMRKDLAQPADQHGQGLVQVKATLMKLSERQIEKMDPLLLDALRRAQGDEVIRAVMVLGPESGDTKREDVSQALNPARFPSHEVYRRALIAKRKNQLVLRLCDTLRALSELSLTPRGGTTSRAVVVEGTAHQILTSLELPGVSHASLDRPIGLIEPHRGGQGKPNSKHRW